MNDEIEQPPAGGDNALLASLPAREQKAAHRASKRFALVAGDTILHHDTTTLHAYFPIDGVISLVRVMGEGRLIEIAVVGAEGVVGIDVFMGAETQLNDAIVQAAGSAWQMPASYLAQRFRRSRAMQVELLRYTDAFITQISQTAACNRIHGLDARLARWLLMMDDRVAAPQITLTQQFLGQMLGARTASVNEAVQKLEALDVIGHSRRRITVLDREGLERMACECYAIVHRVYQRSLGEFALSEKTAYSLLSAAKPIPSPKPLRML